MAVGSRQGSAHTLLLSENRKHQVMLQQTELSLRKNSLTSRHTSMYGNSAKRSHTRLKPSLSNYSMDTWEGRIKDVLNHPKALRQVAVMSAGDKKQHLWKRKISLPVQCHAALYTPTYCKLRTLTAHGPNCFFIHNSKYLPLVNLKHCTEPRKADQLTANLTWDLCLHG